jgi:hypothetical protein
MRTLVLLLVCGIVVGVDAYAVGNREEILEKAEEYTQGFWQIDAEHEMDALYDRPGGYRYAEAFNTCSYVNYPSSPLVIFFRDFGGNNWGVPMWGYPYAYGKKMLPAACSGYVSGGCEEAIAEEQDTWRCRNEHDWYPTAFAGCIDCSGFAMYVTDYITQMDWLYCNTTCLFDEPTEHGEDSYFMKRCDDGDCGSTDYASYEKMEMGDQFVKAEWHVATLVGYTDSYHMEFTEATGAANWERCADRNAWAGTYVDYLRAHWRGMSVRTLVDGPATCFWDARALANGEEVDVSWTTAYRKNNWGFFIEWSVDMVDWNRVSDYIVLDYPDSQNPEEFHWSGNLDEGWVRVVEVERGSQRLSTSMVVDVSLD